MRYFSTFSGIGGFELGIGKRAECVGYSEVDKYAISNLPKELPRKHKAYGDITKINPSELFPTLTCIVGGFPCQAFLSRWKKRRFQRHQRHSIF
jgi:DNA (cytosine-5)-methyltransferase 1